MGITRTDSNGEENRLHRNLDLTVRLFWKLVRRFGSLVSSEITSSILMAPRRRHLETGWPIGGQLSLKFKELQNRLKFNTLKFSKPRKNGRTVSTVPLEKR